MISRESSRAGIKWAFILAWMSTGLATVTLFVFARILGPEVFGIMAMATVLFAGVTIAMDGGLALSVIQSKDLSHTLASSVFWGGLASSILFGLLSILAAESYATFRQQPVLAELVVAESGAR